MRRFSQLSALCLAAGALSACSPDQVVKTDPIPSDQEQLAEQAIAECPRAALLREG